MNHHQPNGSPATSSDTVRRNDSVGPGSMALLDVAPTCEAVTPLHLVVREIVRSVPGVDFADTHIVKMAQVGADSRGES